MKKRCSNCRNREKDIPICFYVSGENEGHATEIGDKFVCDNHLFDFEYLIKQANKKSIFGYTVVIGIFVLLVAFFMVVFGYFLI